METLCNAHGDPLEGTCRKTFPTPQRLAGLTEGDLRRLGLGYRAPYILDAARQIAAPQHFLNHRHIQRNLGIQHLADRAALFGLARRLLDHRAVALA